MIRNRLVRLLETQIEDYYKEVEKLRIEYAKLEEQLQKFKQRNKEKQDALNELHLLRDKKQVAITAIENLNKPCLLDQNIYITSIIVDNLKCQTLGLELMKTVTENPLINVIYIVHCFCHLVSLVFVNTLNNNSHLAQLVNSIKEIVTILRKSSSKNFIGKTCPTIVQNVGYIYLHEILNFFFQKFENEIKTILIADNEEELLENDYIKAINPPDNYHHAFLNIKFRPNWFYMQFFGNRRNMYFI